MATDYMQLNAALTCISIPIEVENILDRRQKRKEKTAHILHIIWKWHCKYLWQCPATHMWTSNLIKKSIDFWNGKISPFFHSIDAHKCQCTIGFESVYTWFCISTIWSRAMNRFWKKKMVFHLLTILKITYCAMQTKYRIRWTKVALLHDLYLCERW